MSYIRRSKGSLTRALISRIAANDTSLKSILSRIATRCRDLKHLEIRLDGFPIVGILDTIPIAQGLSTLILHCVLRFEVIGMLLALCPHLVHVEFHQVQYLSRNSVLWPSGIERIRTLYLRHYRKSCARVEYPLIFVCISPLKFLFVDAHHRGVSITDTPKATLSRPDTKPSGANSLRLARHCSPCPHRLFRTESAGVSHLDQLRH